MALTKYKIGNLITTVDERNTIGIRDFYGININKELKKFCDKKKVCTYIDIYNHLLDDDGNLKLEYTRDGLHVSDEAYNIITDILMPYIKENNNN